MKVQFLIMFAVSFGIVARAQETEAMNPKERRKLPKCEIFKCIALRQNAAFLNETDMQDLAGQLFTHEELCRALFNKSTYPDKRSEWDKSITNLADEIMNQSHLPSSPVTPKILSPLSYSRDQLSPPHDQ